MTNNLQGLLFLLYVLGHTHLSRPQDFAINNDNNALPAEDEIAQIEDLWTTFDDKPTPLYRCQGWYGGNKMAIPEPPNCEIPRNPSVNKVVSLTLYLPDIGRQSLNGYECYCVRTVMWRYHNLFYQESSGSQIEYFPVKEKTCWDMVQQRKGPNGEVMETDNNGITGTSDNEFYFLNTWMQNRSSTVLNYYFREVSVTVFDLDKSILTSTDIKKPCLYNATKCDTALGTLVWKSDQVRTCRLKEIGRTTCLFSNGTAGSRVTCPDLQLSLHKISSHEMCSLYFGTSAQGYFFLQDEIGQVNNEIGVPGDVSGRITKPKQRQKRNAEEDGLNPHDAFMNGKFSFLYDTLKDNMESAFKTIHHDVCQTNLMMWTFMVNVAKTGHPSLLVQTLYNDPSLRATFSGDSLSIWQCKKILSYKFLKRESCFYEWPVEYVENGKHFKGYMLPLSHAFTGTPVSMPEPCPEFYFNAGDYHLHLTEKGPKLVRLPFLPQPNIGIVSINLPDIVFNSTYGIEINQYTDYMHTLTLIREMQVRIELVRKINKSINDVQESVAPFQQVISVVSSVAFFAWDVISTITGPIISYVIWPTLSYLVWPVISNSSFLLGLLTFVMFIIACCAGGPMFLVSSLFALAVKCMLGILQLFVRFSIHPLQRLFQRQNEVVFVNDRALPNHVDEVPQVVVLDEGRSEVRNRYIASAPNNPPPLPPRSDH